MKLNPEKCCAVCEDYETYMGVCLCADSEWFADFPDPDACCPHFKQLKEDGKCPCDHGSDNGGDHGKDPKEDNRCRTACI